MNHPDDMDQILVDWLQDGAYQAPEAPIEEAIAHARRNPRRRTFAIFRRDPMAGRAGPQSWVGGSLAFVLLAVALAAALVAAGAFLHVDLWPIAASSPAGPSAEPSHASSPNPTPSASTAPFVRGIEPGTALTASLLGGWYASSVPAFPWFLPAGNPYCVNDLNTTQDCMAWVIGDGTGRVVNTAVATIVGGNLALRWIGGPCNGQKSQMAPRLVRNQLTLTWLSGSCVSGDFVLTSPGAGGAPTAAPPPNP